MKNFLVDYIDDCGAYRNIAVQARNLTDLREQFECAVFGRVSIVSINVID